MLKRWAAAAAEWTISAVSAFFRALGFRACRYEPTCSVYARQAYRECGFWEATRLSAGRLLSCHPWSPGGHAPLVRLRETRKKS